MRINAENGKEMSSAAHIRQSIYDIIKTPKGSRPMEPDYGCDLFGFIDAKMSGENTLRVSQSVHEAVERWEPRVRVIRTEPSIVSSSGRWKIRIFLDSGDNFEVQL